MFISNLGNLKYDKNNSYKKINIRVINRHYNTRVNLLSNNKRISLLISRMVAIMFIPIPKKYSEKGLSFKDLEVDHIDAKEKWDNSVFNLQWLTSKENKEKAYKMKEHVYCEDRPNTTIKNSQVILLCELFQENKLTVEEMSKKTRIPVDTIYNIKIGKTWKEITKNYNISNYNVIKGRHNSQENIHSICKMLEENKYTDKEIADACNSSVSLVNNIKNKHRWTSVSKKYNF